MIRSQHWDLEPLETARQNIGLSLLAWLAQIQKQYSVIKILDNNKHIYPHLNIVSSSGSLTEHNKPRIKSNCCSGMEQGPRGGVVRAEV